MNWIPTLQPVAKPASLRHQIRKRPALDLRTVTPRLNAVVQGVKPGRQRDVPHSCQRQTDSMRRVTWTPRRRVTPPWYRLKLHMPRPLLCAESVGPRASQSGNNGHVTMTTRNHTAKLPMKRAMQSRQAVCSIRWSWPQTRLLNLAQAIQSHRSLANLTFRYISIFSRSDGPSWTTITCRRGGARRRSLSIFTVRPLLLYHHETIANLEDTIDVYSQTFARVIIDTLHKQRHYANSACYEAVCAYSWPEAKGETAKHWITGGDLVTSATIMTCIANLDEPEYLAWPGG